MSQSGSPRRVTVDDIVHTGPGTLGGQYMRMFWHPVYVAHTLAPGCAMPIMIMNERFTLDRGQGGRPHVVAFQCAHRGTQLSTGWVEGDDIRCFYHGWKYNASGQCVQQPAEDPSQASKARIRAYPTEEYLGLIFVYIGEGDPPPLPRYPELEEDGVLEVNEVVVWPCNFYNRVENSADEVHVAFVHRNSEFTENGLIDVPAVSAEETEFGFTKYGQRASAPVRVSHFHMPNVNYIKNAPTDESVGWVEHLSWRVPVDDGSCASYTLSLTHVTGEAADTYRQRRKRAMAGKGGENATAAALAPLVLEGKLRIDDIQDRTFIVNVQDYVAQVGQGAIADRHNEMLGRSDRVVVLMRRIWLRELQALLDGKPLKTWRRTGHLLATAGV